jgi:hypothetical protein
MRVNFHALSSQYRVSRCVVGVLVRQRVLNFSVLANSSALPPCEPAVIYSVHPDGDRPRSCPHLSRQLHKRPLRGGRRYGVASRIGISSSHLIDQVHIKLRMCGLRQIRKRHNWHAFTAVESHSAIPCPSTYAERLGEEGERSDYCQELIIIGAQVSQTRQRASGEVVYSPCACIPVPASTTCQSGPRRQT